MNNPTPQITTKLEVFHPETDRKIIGNEEFPVIGGQIKPEEVKSLMPRYKNLNYYWDCIPKAQILRDYLCVTRKETDYQILVGSLFILSSDYQSAYGYSFKPPFEMHAWVWHGRLGIVYDFGLPGVIAKGHITYDKQGPILDEGRRPMVAAFLLGTEPGWLRYNPAEVYSYC